MPSVADINKLVLHIAEPHPYPNLRNTVGPPKDRDVECGICLEEMLSSHTTMNHDDCGNRFHSECMEMWLVNIVGTAHTCPKCRAVIANNIDMNYHYLTELLTRIDGYDRCNGIPPDPQGNATQRQLLADAVEEAEVAMVEVIEPLVDRIRRSPLTDIASSTMPPRNERFVEWARHARDWLINMERHRQAMDECMITLAHLVLRIENNASVANANNAANYAANHVVNLLENATTNTEAVATFEEFPESSMRSTVDLGPDNFANDDTETDDDAV